ncbi:hypothetical protein SELMODRAFT_268581 [Selaginella moellendorffii]|uniref:ENTH domain-containing protein n=1 Tax=Selaginella moellendorffii TaxID=88036 RepID=D8SGD8_SELML|nr:putative clathrin assembly protein At5g57200 [Selaginella moellendorffii]EFJ16671.1 hypothetical protein SELMODRAFT_268581 [Selaginella moellendorffii]|eukprot:XP_002982426.1 putative clathrin assembly protein At5g57200 [Selaginella moellendorffii]
MAGGSKTIRKALGALKDSTKVGLAKVNSEFKDLDIAVVKATNHVECPPKEKHVRTIFLATSAARPRADVAYCIHALARRISKTHTWTVALKALMVIHRTLREGDPTFREELINYSRNRAHILNLSNFKDDSSPNAWDYSAWVRTYALFLEERLECFRILKYDVESERSSGHSRTRELDTIDLLEQLPSLQQLLHRLMGCQPEGAATSNHVIQYALGLVFKESFKLYRAINDGIINLVDKFFEMQRHDAIKALEVYKRAGQQAERLSEFYEICKGLDLARSFQFPTLEQPPQSFLTTMEEYVKDAPRLAIVPKDLALEYNGERLISNRIAAAPTEPEPVDEPAPEAPPAPAPAPPKPIQSSAFESNDLLGLGEMAPSPSALDESNALALAIVPSGPTANGTSESNGAWAPQSGTTGWELALVTNPSSNENAVSSSRLAGGFDKLTLDSLYDDALSRRPQQQYAGGAGTSYGGPPQMMNPFDTMNHDPFMASGKFAPPPNVQMAAMAQHQQALFLQQQQQQQMMSRNPHNPFGVPAPPNANPQFQNNPFGNPGLI